VIENVTGTVEKKFRKTKMKNWYIYKNIMP